MSVMHLPTLRQLQFLIAIAENGSFSKAAQACSVTQPTLSSAIKDLEAQLGAQLLERQARGASLTPAGESVVRRSRSVMNDMHDLVAAASEAGAPLSGEFRLGAIPTVAPYVLPDALPVIRQRHPELKLYLREDLTDRLIEALHARKLDAAIIALPWEMSGIDTMTLYDDEFLLIAPSKHKLLEKEHVGTDDLADEDVLLLEDGHCLRAHAKAVCALTHGRKGVEVSATSLQTLVQMVAGELGVSLVPKLALDAGVAAGLDVDVRSFKTPIYGRSIGVAWRKGSPRSEEAELIGLAIKDGLGF